MSEDPFLTHRSLLFTVAYEILGSAADAEDVVQETWLRWSEVEQPTVRDARAYLVRVVTRQALNRLRTLARRREDYVGEWLPEPLLTGPDVADDVEMAESVSLAMLTVLETLAPTERAVFVLREVFDVPYTEIAETIGKSTVAVRQVAHRARQHVAERRPRMRVDQAEQKRMLDACVAAIRTGAAEELIGLLAPDVVLVADGGGVANAVRRPVVSARKVANLLCALGRLAPGFEVGELRLNGAPALVLHVEGETDSVLTGTVEDGRLTRLYVLRNPDKLGRLLEETELAR